MTVTAFERILDELRDQGKQVKLYAKEARTQCPSHESRRSNSKPLAIYPKPGKAKVVCFVGCNDALDILPALGLTVADLYDERRDGAPSGPADPETQAWINRMLARSKARKAITPPQRAVDDLLHDLPDLGERLCLGAARIRPELYIWEREQLGDLDG